MGVSAHVLLKGIPLARGQFRRERGAAAVEFALIVPIVLLLVFGVIDFARLVTTYTTVRSAAREAVRYGSALGDDDDQYEDCAGMRAAATSRSVVPQLDDSDISIRYVDADSDSTVGTCGSAPSGDPGSFRLEVAVSREFTSITPLINEFIDGLNVTSTSRRTIFTWE